MINKQVLTILLVILSFAAIVANALGYIGVDIMLVVLGLTGSGSVTAWRSWINSQGYKTYVLVGFVILGTGAFIMKWISIDQFMLIFGILFGGQALTVTHAYVKAPAGEKIKKNLNP